MMLYSEWLKCLYGTDENNENDDEESEDDKEESEDDKEASG